MSTNFDFLKPLDKDLFEIITEAEKLYRDEYFEQCMAQTRRFGENVCKKVLGENHTPDDTFDNMLATLKDKVKEEQEKEFIDDLYFLKKNGNTSVHSAKVKKDGMTALECLQRAFEIAISFSVYNKGGKSEILRLRYDTELLVTGKKSTKSLAERYAEEKAYETRNIATLPRKKKKTAKKQSYKMATSTPKKKFSIFWILLGITTGISLGTILTLLLIAKL